MPEVFRNEPAIDFRGRRTAGGLLRSWIRTARESNTVESRRPAVQWFESVNPANPKEIVGRVRSPSTEASRAGYRAAAGFFPKWRATPAEKRAAILLRAAAKSCGERRLELAAWEVFEVGKGWREADADVIEAIDYLAFYAREMRPACRTAPDARTARRKQRLLCTSRAAWRRLSRHGIFPWRFSPA